MKADVSYLRTAVEPHGTLARLSIECAAGTQGYKTPFAFLIEPWTRSRAPTLLVCLRLILPVQLAFWLTLHPLTICMLKAVSPAPLSLVSWGAVRARPNVGGMLDIS